MALVLTTDQAAIITALEAPMEEAFANGVTVTGGSPATLPAYNGWTKLQADQKTLTKNSIKTLLSAYIAVGAAAPTYINISTYQNGYSNWGDANYSGGNARFWKGTDGMVHVEGLVKAPPSPGSFQTMVIMPVGFRPAPNDGRIFACVHNDVFCSIQIGSDGTIVFRGTPTANGWISLNLHYRAGG